MKKLLSLPPNLVRHFHDITGLDRKEWFCTNDPVGHKLGSGGGTAWVLKEAYEHEGGGLSFPEWLARDKRLILHAGGQSRRLPAYAPSGKILTPVPVFRWERGQRLSQDLLSLQIPLYERIMSVAPKRLNTLVVSGDVYIRSAEHLQPIPDVDVVCYGLWLSPDIAKDHGVYVSAQSTPSKLKFMLQKPSVSTLARLQTDNYFLTDIGVWLLSDRAVKLLIERSKKDGKIANYDLYGTFGCCLGTDPTIDDPEIKSLKVAVLPLPGGEFYHFGTSKEIISSTLSIQNLVNDQREIMHHSRKPHPSIFQQNSEVWIKFNSENKNLWIENSCVSGQWTISADNIITGVPENNWKIELRKGQCADIVPIGEKCFVVRPYGINDKFRGAITASTTMFLGRPFAEWAQERRIDIAAIEGAGDLQSARIFPVVDNINDVGLVLRWMLNEPLQQGGSALWARSRKMSADEISDEANLVRLSRQRRQYRAMNWPFLAKNYAHSVFYQVDLDDAAHEFAANNIAEPSPLPDSETMLIRIHDAMFRSELERLRGKDYKANEAKAFGILRDGLTQGALAAAQNPSMTVHPDQIVWARSPVRIDLAGGWTDTPPYCLMEGGSVVNLAIELNGQPPLQAYVKPSGEPQIILRSIDLGATEVITTYEELADFKHVGSPFAIPKAALALAGFLPAFSAERYSSLEEQLRAFGCGIEITTLAAIPAGSGLGTSSILASTVLSALNDFCGLTWDKTEIGSRTLVLEQLLTTGGGWQDQFGGLLPGVKLLQTDKGFDQRPIARWLPTTLFALPEYAQCHLLYYTGITRTAKNILSEIVRRMFLNNHDEIAMLREMKEHAVDMFEATQREDFNSMSRLVGKTWLQNQAIDCGTNPEAVKAITDMVSDLCAGYKLPGAGGGGYLYMIAKDPEAAARIRQILNSKRPNDNARFVRMSLSTTGLQVSRS